jgi:hypothetical protein
MSSTDLRSEGIPTGAVHVRPPSLLARNVPGPRHMSTAKPARRRRPSRGCTTIDETAFGAALGVMSKAEWLWAAALVATKTQADAARIRFLRTLQAAVSKTRL